MKPDVKRILTKLSENKIELAAKKPAAILKSANALQDKAQKAEESMEKVYNKYREGQQEYMRKLSDIEDKAMDLDDDLDRISALAKDLGIKPEQIDGYDKAQGLVKFMKSAADNFRAYQSL